MSSSQYVKKLPSSNVQPDSAGGSQHLSDPSTYNPDSELVIIDSHTERSTWTQDFRFLAPSIPSKNQNCGILHNHLACFSPYAARTEWQNSDLKQILQRLALKLPVKQPAQYQIHSVAELSSENNDFESKRPPKYGSPRRQHFSLNEQQLSINSSNKSKQLDSTPKWPKPKLSLKIKLKSNKKLTSTNLKVKPLGSVSNKENVGPVSNLRPHAHLGVTFANAINQTNSSLAVPGLTSYCGSPLLAKSYRDNNKIFSRRHMTEASTLRDLRSVCSSTHSKSACSPRLGLLVKNGFSKKPVIPNNYASFENYFSCQNPQS